MRRACDLLDLCEQYCQRILQSPKALALLDALFANPFINAAKAREILHVTDPTARQVIQKLTAAGILTPEREEEYARTHVARAILRIIEEDQIILPATNAN